MAIGPPTAGHLDADREQYLACGRPLTQVWQHAHTAGPPDPHTTRCPYCQQALQSLATLEEATAALRTQQAGGHHLVSTIMRAVRTEMHLGRILPLDDPALDLRVAENTAAKLLRQAADHVPGATAASCRLTPSGDGTAIHVSLTLAAEPHLPLHPLASQVRERVLQAAEHELGLRVLRVDIHIADLLPPPEAASTQPGAPR